MLISKSNQGKILIGQSGEKLFNMFQKLFFQKKKKNSAMIPSRSWNKQFLALTYNDYDIMIILNSTIIILSDLTVLKYYIIKSPFIHFKY